MDVKVTEQDSQAAKHKNADECYLLRPGQLKSPDRWYHNGEHYGVRDDVRDCLANEELDYADAMTIAPSGPSPVYRATLEDHGELRRNPPQHDQEGQRIYLKPEVSDRENSDVEQEHR